MFLALLSVLISRSGESCPVQRLWCRSPCTAPTPPLCTPLLHRHVLRAGPHSHQPSSTHRNRSLESQFVHALNCMPPSLPVILRVPTCPRPGGTSDVLWARTSCAEHSPLPSFALLLQRGGTMQLKDGIAPVFAWDRKVSPPSNPNLCHCLTAADMQPALSSFLGSPYIRWAHGRGYPTCCKSSTSASTHARASNLCQWGARGVIKCNSTSGMSQPISPLVQACA